MRIQSVLGFLFLSSISFANANVDQVNCSLYRSPELGGSICPLSSQTSEQAIFVNYPGPKNCLQMTFSTFTGNGSLKELLKELEFSIDLLQTGRRTWYVITPMILEDGRLQIPTTKTELYGATLRIRALSGKTIPSIIERLIRLSSATSGVVASVFEAECR